MKSIIKDNEAIHCKTQEEWERVCDVLKANGEERKGLQYVFKQETDNCISYRNWLLGFSSLKWHKNEGYTITPASDFLARNGVKVKSIEDKIREILSVKDCLWAKGKKDIAVAKLTELFNALKSEQ